MGFSPKDFSLPFTPGVKWEEIGLEEIVEKTKNDKIEEIANEGNEGLASVLRQKLLTTNEELQQLQVCVPN